MARGLKRRALYTDDYEPIFFTYYLKFPKGEEWCDQVEFYNSHTKDGFEYELNKTNFPPDIKMKLRHKKQASWKDHNGVEHSVIVETKRRERVWGSKRDR